MIPVGNHDMSLSHGSYSVHNSKFRDHGLLPIDYESSYLIFIRMKKGMSLLELFSCFINKYISDLIISPLALVGFKLIERLCKALEHFRADVVFNLSVILHTTQQLNRTKKGRFHFMSRVLFSKIKTPHIDPKTSDANFSSALVVLF